MSKKLKFIWIDDDPTRERSAIILEKLLKVRCHFINVQDEDSDYLNKITKIGPDLILVDHNLTNSELGDIKKGSTVASLIRETHPSIAIACITGQGSHEITDIQQRLAYEAVFDYSDIKAQYSSMKSIAESFKKLKTNKPTSSDDLIEMLKVPEDEIDRLKNIIPHEIKDNYYDPSLFSNISYWVRNVLMARPGFLYDSLWAATLLGLNETGFKKVEQMFTTALYKGLFKDESQKRWWKSSLLEILGTKVKSSGLPWEKGRLLNDSFNSRHYSKDYYSDYKEPYPETVAFTDETSNQRVQIKLKYTVPHPKFEKLLFFDDIKMMKAD